MKSNSDNETRALLRVREDTMHKIAILAATQHVTPDEFANQILDRHIDSQLSPTKQDGVAFLTSMAGIFKSGIRDTSERAHDIVADVILRKYGKL